MLWGHKLLAEFIQLFIHDHIEESPGESMQFGTNWQKICFLRVKALILLFFGWINTFLYYRFN